MGSKVVFFAFEERYAKTAIARHKHRCAELVYYLAGEGTLTIENRRYPIHGGMFSFMPGDVQHGEYFRKNGKVLFIGFENADLAKQMEEGSFPLPVSSPVPTLLHAILEEGKAQRKYRDQLMAAKLEEILILLLRMRSSDRRERKSLAYAVKFIDENYTHKINLRELAMACGYGYDYFHHEFSRETQLSPSQYISNRRLRYAQELLSSTDMNCTEIAYASGFSNAAQFSTMFKARYGVSPSQLRKGYVGSGEEAMQIPAQEMDPEGLTQT